MLGRLLAAGIAALAFVGVAHAEPMRLSPAVKAKIDAAAQEELASGRVAGAAVAVLRDGKLVFAKGYGHANLELAAPVNAKTVFRIGSLTKQFTAAGVLLLAEQGKLKIDDKLSLYLPNFPRANEVTLRDLLNHTSGIHNFTEGPGDRQNLDERRDRGGVGRRHRWPIAALRLRPGNGLVVQQLQLRASGRRHREGVRQELGRLHEDRNLRQAWHGRTPQQMTRAMSSPAALRVTA